MKVYEKVYVFNVLRELRKKDIIYYFDKLLQEGGTLNSLRVENLFGILARVESEDGRFEFYKIIDDCR